MVFSVFLVAAILAGLTPVSSSVAQQAGFVRYRVELEREMGELYPFDLTGNGQKELIVVELDRSSRDPEPYLTVYRAAGDGFKKFDLPAARLPADLSMAGVGRFPFGPGLVLLSPGKLEIRPWRDSAFREAPGTVLEIESIFVKGGGELKTGLEWIVDLDGDGFHEIIVPRLDGLGILRVAADGAPNLHAFLATRSTIRFWFYLRQNLVAYKLPAMRFLDTDGAGWKDVVAFHDGLLQVFRLDDFSRGLVEPYVEFDLQPPRPFDPKEPWDPPMRLVQAQDLNGDGSPDLVFIKFAAQDSALNTKTSVLIYYGRQDENGAGFRLPGKPDQVYASEGFSLPILTDINGDGRIDLALVNVEIGFWNAIKALIARTVTAETAFYMMPEEGRYPKTPDDVVDYSISFSLGKFSHRPIVTFGDLNGDRRPDLLLSTDKSSLGIHWGLAGEFWESGHDVLLEDFLPTKPVRFRVSDLDGDGRDDLIFLYDRNDIRQMPEMNHKFTVLLSRFPKPETREVAGSR